MEKIKDSHILIIAAGASVKKYWTKIKQFIKENNAITIGCNNINDILIPDYNMWGSSRRYRKYRKSINKSSIVVVPIGFKNRHPIFWRKNYKEYSTDERLPGTTTITHKTIYHYFKNITMTSILFAYSYGASKISVAGMDGYTFYSEDELKTNKFSQHCYGEGFSDGQDYVYCKRKDIRTYNVLKDLYSYGKEKYGFYFEIITPTIYTEYYNFKTLDIEEKYRGKDISLEDKINFKIDKNKKFIENSKY